VDQIFSVWVDAGGGGDRRPSRVYAGHRRRARTADLAQAFAVLESEIRQCVAAGAERRTFVHAGVVGWRGRAIVVPGRSRSGKTTLVAELVKAGALYLSDEFAVLDGRGRVHPFAKPLSIRGAGGCDVHVQSRRAEDLGGACATRPLPVGLVVLAEHRPGAAWRPQRLTTGQAVLEMLGHTVPVRLRPEASLVALERAVARATVLKGERGEAREVAGLLLRCVEDEEPVSRRGTGERGTT
jgi:serine kinase of HPr protein (carbohydrate metabolism regulator)